MDQEGKGKKPIFKRLWWLWAIVIFIIGMVVGDSLAINRVNKQINSIDTPTSKEDKVKKETEEKDIKVIDFTEEGDIGNLGIKVLEAKEKDAISNEAGKSSPSGKFIVIKMEIKNNGEEATEYNPHDFKLKEDKKTFEVDDNSFEALGSLNSQETIYNENKSFIGPYDKFNAGISKNTYIVFDVPKEIKAENLKLIVEQDKSLQFNLK